LARRLPRPRPERVTTLDAPPPEPPRPAAEADPARRRWRIAAAVGALLAVQWALAVSSLVRENATIDEVIHLPAGITYWQTGRFRLYHHNPPLVKLIAAVPVLLSGARTDLLYRGAYWLAEPPNKAGFAHEFAKLNADQYFELFARARLLMPLFATLGGLVVFAWSRRLYGDGGGLLSLALWTFCPNILAHGRLVTTDVGATAIGVGATYLFWRYLHQPTWRRAFAAGLALGVAQLAKFSLLLLYGLWPLLWGIHTLLSLGWKSVSGRILRAAGQGFVMVALSVLVINFGYGFEGIGKPLGRFNLTCRMLTRDVQPVPPQPVPPINPLHEVSLLRVNRFRGTVLEGLPVPLPREYVVGFDDQKLEADGLPERVWNRGAPAGMVRSYPVYLDGVLRAKSWPDYYLRALAYKVPEGTWALVLLSLVILVASRRSRAPWADELALLIPPAVVLGVMSFGTNINLGLRYVLPIFPYVYITAGKLVPWVAGLRRAARWAAGAFVGACLAATVAATASIHPHYLAYFNWASGGPDRGSEHLIDSNLDWGQDLVGLRDWVEKNAHGEPLGLAYFGQIPPAIFAARGRSLNWYLPPPLPGSWQSLPPPRFRLPGSDQGPKPGLYAVSASLVRGLPWRVYDSYLEPEGDPRVWWPYSADAYAFSYFGGLRPFHKIGHSIFLYQITEQDAARLARHWERPGG
jgi:hypothetical protein